MEDIYNTTLLCEECNAKTRKVLLDKEGCKLRGWECPSCNKVWEHPKDAQEVEQFKRIQQKEFEVKLRMVGNSYTISIPKEIILFEQEMEKQLNHLLKLNLEEPEKLSIYFHRKIKRIW